MLYLEESVYGELCANENASVVSIQIGASRVGNFHRWTYPSHQEIEHELRQSGSSLHVALPSRGKRFAQGLHSRVLGLSQVCQQNKVHVVNLPLEELLWLQLSICLWVAVSNLMRCVEANASLHFALRQGHP